MTADPAQSRFFLLAKFLCLGAVLLVTACAGVPGSRMDIEQDKAAARQGCTLIGKGLASWYGKEMGGNRTANGEWFNPDGVTAAHRTLPFGTIVKVTMDGGRGNPDGVFVRINDRGPFVHGRIIDLSKGAADRLGMKDTRPVHVYRCS